VEVPVLSHLLRHWPARETSLHTNAHFKRALALPRTNPLQANLIQGITMKVISATERCGLLSLVIIVLASCGGDDGTGPNEFPGDTRGSLAITLLMMGADLDTDGCTISLDGGTAQRVMPSDTLVYSDIEAGTHSVTVGDVKDNCTLLSGNPRNVTVAAGDTTFQHFTVECAATFPPEIADWLKANAVPFATADLSQQPTDFSDLTYLKDAIGSARVVGLGEATHGTREFFQMKHRVLALLVKELGFNTFAIEATWPEANRINDYLHTGVGDPQTLLSGLYFWTWNTEEVLEMIQWMRNHNLNPGGAPQVSFFGFDMQYPGMAIHNVILFLQPIDAAGATFATDRYSCMQAYANDPRGSFPAAYADASATYQNTCRDDLDEVYDWLLANRGTLEAASSSQEFARALRSARVVVQYEDMAAERTPWARDLYMAENAVWLHEQAGPGSKVVLWAHNLHVSQVTGWMGSHLRAHYANDYVIVGFDFYRGSFQAVTLTDTGYGSLIPHSVGPPPAHSYEYYFHGAELPRLTLDLRGITFDSPATSWLAGPRDFRSIGAVFRPSAPQLFFYQARLPQEYDVIIYFDQTAAAVGLPYDPPDNW